MSVNNPRWLRLTSSVLGALALVSLANLYIPPRVDAYGQIPAAAEVPTELPPGITVTEPNPVPIHVRSPITTTLRSGVDSGCYTYTSVLDHPYMYGPFGANVQGEGTDVLLQCAANDKACTYSGSLCANGSIEMTARFEADLPGIFITGKTALTDTTTGRSPDNSYVVYHHVQAVDPSTATATIEATSTRTSTPTPTDKATASPTPTDKATPTEEATPTGTPTPTATVVVDGQEHTIWLPIAVK